MAEKFKLAALWACPEVTFNTDPDADGSDYKFLKVAGEIAFQPAADVLPRPGQTNDLVVQEHVIGAKGGTISFPLEMKGSGTPAASAVVAIASESSPILLAAMGQVLRGTGTTCTGVGDGSVGTPLTVTSAAGLSVGMMIMVASQLRFIKQIIGSTLVLNRALSAVPAAAVVVTASSMFTRLNSNTKSLSFVGKRGGLEYTFTGCKVAFKLTGITARGTALLQVTVDVNSWTPTTKASLPATTLTGITAVKGPVIKGGTMTVDGVEEVTADLELDPGLESIFQDSVAADEGRAGVELVNSHPSGVIHPYYAAGHLTTFLAGTTVELAAAFGTTSNGFGFYVPKAQWLQPAIEDRNGLVGEGMPWQAVNNGTAADISICQF